MMRLASIFFNLLVGLAGLAAFGNGALAQACNVVIDQMNFGTVQSVNLTTSTTVATMTVDCTGQAGQTIRLCPSLQSGDVAHTTNGTYKVRVSLFSDANTTMPLQAGVDILLDGSGAGQATQSIYGRLSQSSPGIKSGQHTATLNLALFGSYLSTGALCSAPVSAALRPTGVSRAATRVKAVSPKP